MALKEYRKKRHFERTPEPAGTERPSGSGRLFVVHKHAARRLHYDVRLELEGVLKSWAVPKGPSLDPANKRLAAHVEDHPIDYGAFEGIIPEGEYGGGTVMLWDRGEWEPLGDPRQDYQRGRLKFRLYGEKLRGGWNLVRMGGRAAENDKNWLLIKEGDEEARTGGAPDVVDESPHSVASGRSLEEIAVDAGKVWSGTEGLLSGAKAEAAVAAGRRKKAARRATSGRRRVPTTADEPAGEAQKGSKAVAVPDVAQLSNARQAPMPESFSPQLATLVTEPPGGDDWLHEIKFDGYRLLCFKRGDDIRLVTRHAHDWTGRFPEVVAAVGRLPVGQALLDGEVVVLTPQGTTDFQALQNVLKSRRTGQVAYFVFDLPWCAGYDLGRTPLLERKEALRGLVESAAGRDGATAACVLRYSDHIRGEGEAVFRNACRFATEGIVSKRVDSPYERRRSRTWLKVKCLRRQEFVIGAWTAGSGSRVGFGALLLGYYDDQQRLVYCGKVGTGFTDQSLKTIHERLRRIEQPKPPFVKAPRGAEARKAHWVKPELVCEVAFSDWTSDNMLRHPSFQGLREDKRAEEVRRESPVPVPEEHREDAKSATEAKKKRAKSGGGAARSKIVTRKESGDGPAGSRAVGRKKSGDAAGAPPAVNSPPLVRPDDKRTEFSGVRLSNPDRVLYPEQGITKRELAAYYERIADWILPHVTGRPLALVRCPRGHTEHCFFQKHVNETLPEYIKGVKIIEQNKTETHVVIEDLRSLIALAQLGVLEIHPWGCRADAVDAPDRLVFDLDPGPNVAWERVNEAARRVRDRLAELGLRSWVKTTGGKGLHVVAPVARRIGWDELKEFAKGVTMGLVRERPNEYVGVMTKAKRVGKIFIDYLRNGRGATSVAAYSTRRRTGAPVSMPVAWEELTPDLTPDGFNIRNVPRRLAGLKTDPWAGFCDLRQAVTARAQRALGVK